MWWLVFALVKILAFCVAVVAAMYAIDALAAWLAWKVTMLIDRRMSRARRVLDRPKRHYR